MSKFAFLANGSAMTVAAGAVVVAGAAAVTWSAGVFSKPQQVEMAPAPAAPAAMPDRDVEVSADLAASAEPAEIQNAEPDTRFDMVRVEADGSAMIAGQASAGSEVKIKLDGVVIATATAAGDGNFASFVDVPVADQPQVMTLENANGADSAPAVEQVIIAPAPVPAPVMPQHVPETVETAVLADSNVQAREGATSEIAAIEEPAAPTVMIASKDGVQVLPSSGAVGVSTALLDAISYDAQGEVALSGRASAGFVRVYLDNAPITTSRIPQDGNWRADLPQVDTGIYTLRVDQIDDVGAVVARVETPFKREATEVLQAASAPDLPVQAITVQPGATLWAIARDQYGSGTLYTKLVTANAETIRNPDLIYPGQIFAIPE